MAKHATLANLLKARQHTPMIKAFNNLFASLLLIGSISGCVAAAAGGVTGASTVAYLQGEYLTNEKASLEQLYDAALLAVAEIGYTVTIQKKDGLRAEIVASGADDRELKVWLDRRTDTETRLSIRFGLFGDQEDSKLLHDKIVAKL